MFHLTLRRARLLGAAALLPLAALTMAPVSAAPGMQVAQAQTSPAAVDDVLPP